MPSRPRSRCSGSLSLKGGGSSARAPMLLPPCSRVHASPAESQAPTRYVSQMADVGQIRVPRPAGLERAGVAGRVLGLTAEGQGPIEECDRVGVTQALGYWR